MESQAQGADASRRPIKARGNRLIQGIAAALARSPLTPNAISVLSIAFAAAGAAALWWLPAWGAWLCALGIQLRLLCNLLDGMVAVEGGQSTPTGALYNEVPDRVADSVLLVVLGYAAGLPWAGWLAALLAAATAYIRTLGGALGQPQDFRGPMAKQHRMALMTLACLVAPLEALFSGGAHALQVAVLAIAMGALLTCFTRLRAIAVRLESAP
ncbi:CDP-alcohol phosphatidyltransferase family protein [Luteimonas composti]|uniref:CDP-alcohol phosphatidyltransferase family protein n=1 Tax=Luteimonas composti TaxID=398257 RepID=A0ABT6MSE4_9GAMM|nr:CDP-alcohol phosphatidyltransferase family protein [Luteimonas composti]MDH7453354.1 CDP-alcohol phosphatidyltransferase family protein [Luteimonas composti]